MTAPDLDLFFHPRTIALIGATDDKRKAGYALFRKIVERSEREGGVRLFGPNTNLNAFESFPDLPGKKLALITQSGHQGRPIAQGVELGIGVAAWAPTGNEADLEVADFVEHFADQDDVAVIACYIEGFKSIPRLREAADR